MNTRTQFASLLGHMIALLRHSPEVGASDDGVMGREHKSILQTLHELVAAESFSLRREGTSLSIEGEDVPTGAPFVEQLVTQMQEHRLARIHVAHEASPLDIMMLVRAFALDLTDYGPQHSVENSLLAVGAKSVSVVPVDETAERSRDARVTEALVLSGVLLPDGITPAPRNTPVATVPPRLSGESSPSIAGAGPTAASEYESALNQLLSPSARQSNEMARIAGDASGREVLQEIEQRWRSVAAALKDGRLDKALDEMGTLLRRESEAVSDAEKAAYPGAVERLLNDENLRLFVTRAIDELYARDVVKLVKRAGKPGTLALLDALTKAPTFAERRAYLKALREIEQGTEAIVAMLSHREWFVVRNMADLAGELRIEEAVPALGRAIEHADDRVRRSVGVALAKLGTPDAVQYLPRTLNDPEKSVRTGVAAELNGKVHEALAMPLMAAAEAEEDLEIRSVYLKALGRIGTPGALDALRRAAEPGGLLKNRRSVAVRLAAVEGLAQARGSAQARASLQSLAKDRQREVRDAAERALRDSRKP